MINPWKVEGKIDYEKLIEQFGTERLNYDFPNPHVLIRRRFFFSSRDLSKAIENGFFIYTGRGPSGKMHIGHLPPFLLAKWFQDTYDVNVYIMISDDEKYVYSKDANWEEIQKYADDNIKDILSLGFNSDKTFIFKSSEYIANVYQATLSIARKINFSTAKAVFGFKGDTNIGLIFYTALQIVPTFFEKKYPLIPAGIDQDPYWRIQRDIAESFGYFKASAIHGKFFPSLLGLDKKMSSSQPDSVIWLDENKKSLEKKINKAFSGGQPTIELHRRLGGNPDIDVAYLLLYYLFEEDDSKIEKIREDYRSGKLLTGELKQYAIEKIWQFLEKHQQNKENLDLEKYYNGRLSKEMKEKYLKL